MEPAQEEEEALLNQLLFDHNNFFEGIVFIEGDKMILLVFFWTSISDSTSSDHPDHYSSSTLVGISSDLS